MLKLEHWFWSFDSLMIIVWYSLKICLTQACGFSLNLLPCQQLQRWQGLNWQLVKNKYGGFYKWGYPKWMVYKGKSIYKWMIWGYPYDLGTPHMCSWTIWSAGTWLFLAVRWRWHLRRRLPPSWKKVEQPAGSGSKRSKRAARLSSDLTTSSIIDHLLSRYHFTNRRRLAPRIAPWPAQ